MQRDMPIYWLSWLQRHLLVDTFLVGEDTYLLVLLCYNAINLFSTITKATLKKLQSMWHKKMRDILKRLYVNIFCLSMTFPVATQPLYSIGLGNIWCTKSCLVIPNPENMQKLLKLGRRQLCPCRMEENDILDKLRCQRFKENVVRCSKQIQAQVSASMSGAVKYHSLRVFH